MIPDNSLRMVQLFFLTRGTKRAIINAVSFRCRLPTGKKQTAAGGRIPYGDRLGTYAEHMLEVMSSIDGYKNLSRAMITYRVRHHVR